MKHILVTGGAGFIGRFVVQGLLERKDVEVTVLDNFSNSTAENLVEFEKNPRLRKIVKGNVEDEKLIKSIFETPVDMVFHLAAQINVQTSIEHPEKDFLSNTLGTFTVLEEARKQKAVFILVSTCMVYDFSTTSKPISEVHPTKPRAPYAANKLAAENLVESYFHAYGLPVVILRPFNTYGPYQKTNQEGGVVSVFIQQFLDGKPIRVFGDGTQTRDLLFVKDTANFILQAAFSPQAHGEILNAGLGKDISINDLAVQISQGKVPIEHVPHPHPQSEIKRLWCDASKAQKLLGWKPQYSLKQGITETLHWLKNRKH